MEFTHKIDKTAIPVCNIMGVNVAAINMTWLLDFTEKNIADLSIMTYSDIEELISYMPQNIIFDEEKGVLKYVATEFLEKINSAFEYEKCLNCGAVSHQSVGGMMDFL